MIYFQRRSLNGWEPSCEGFDYNRHNMPILEFENVDKFKKWYSKQEDCCGPREMEEFEIHKGIQKDTVMEGLCVGWLMSEEQYKVFSARYES